MSLYDNVIGRVPRPPFLFDMMHGTELHTYMAWVAHVLIWLQDLCAPTKRCDLCVCPP